MANPDDLVFDEPFVPIANTNTAIGQARFTDIIEKRKTPSNKLPDGEDPAGWFIDAISNQYVNCDGKTPEQLAQDDPKTLKQNVDKERQRRILAEQQAQNALKETQEAVRNADKVLADAAEQNRRIADLEAKLQSMNQIAPSADDGLAAASLLGK